MVVLYLTHKNRFKTGQTMPKQAKQSEKEKPRKPHGFGVFELFWTEISACWTEARDGQPWGRTFYALTSETLENTGFFSFFSSVTSFVTSNFSQTVFPKSFFGSEYTEASFWWWKRSLNFFHQLFRFIVYQMRVNVEGDWRPLMTSQILNCFDIGTGKQ